jgi:hypothetical protein
MVGSICYDSQCADEFLEGIFLGCEMFMVYFFFLEYAVGLRIIILK